MDESGSGSSRFLHQWLNRVTEGLQREPAITGWPDGVRCGLQDLDLHGPHQDLACAIDIKAASAPATGLVSPILLGGYRHNIIRCKTR
jgi:hypothetical protein